MTETMLDTVRVVSAGAGRGAGAMLPTLKEWNRASERLRLRVSYYDPSPGKARALQAEAHGAGVAADASEKRIEEALGAGIGPAEVVVLHLDRPQATEVALRTAAANPAPVLGYLLVRTQQEQLLGLLCVFRPEDRDLKLQGADLFGQLGKLTVRSGAQSVFGRDGKVEHRLAEVLYRRAFAEHLTSNLPKLAVALEPESNPMEVTWDGRLVQPLLVHRSSEWQEPMALASAVLSDPAVPLRRGQQFTIAELGPDGVRFHRVKMRALDGRISLHGTLAMDPAALAALEAAERERARREAEAAIRRAERQTISKTQPVWTTD